METVQIPHDSVEEVAPRIKLDRTHDPFSDPSEVAAEVEEEVDACTDQEEAANDPLGRDQAQDETTARWVASIHGAHPRP